MTTRGSVFRPPNKVDESSGPLRTCSKGAVIRRAVALQAGPGCPPAESCQAAPPRCRGRAIGVTTCGRPSRIVWARVDNYLPCICAGNLLGSACEQAYW